MYKNRGYTLVELLVTIAIIGFVSVAAAMTYNTVTRVSSNTSEQSMVMSQVHLVSGWISRDVQSAVTIQAGSAGNWVCSISRNYWDGAAMVTQTIDYVFVGDKLYRKINSGTGQLIAQYISNPGTDTTFLVSSSDSNTYILNVKAVRNETGFSQQYQINKRITN